MSDSDDLYKVIVQLPDEDTDMYTAYFAKPTDMPNAVIRRKPMHRESMVAAAEQTASMLVRNVLYYAWAYVTASEFTSHNSLIVWVSTSLY